jgi:hypothetical protein
MLDGKSPAWPLGGIAGDSKNEGHFPHLRAMSRRGVPAFQIADCRLQNGGRARPRMVSLVETMMTADSSVTDVVKLRGR